jgi:hypothetical protein
MYYVCAYDENSQVICGSDGSMFADLKTLKGVLNRIKNFHWNRNAVYVGISHINYNNRFAKQPIIGFHSLLTKGNEASRALLKYRPTEQ